MVLHRQHAAQLRQGVDIDHLHHFDTLTVSKTVTSISSWYRAIPSLYILLSIAMLTLSPFCVTCLSRLAIEYCRQRYLCTVVIRTFHCIHTIYCQYHHIIPCVTRSFLHIHNCYLGLCILHKWPYKKRNKLLSKKRTKKFVSKSHSIIPHCT